MPDFAAFHEEQAIPSHAGHDLFVGVDLADVPETGDQEPAFGGGDHLLERGFPSGDDEIHGRFTVFVGQGETVTGGLFLGLLGGPAGIHKVFDGALIDQENALGGHAFTVERRTQLLGMVDVVGDGDVFAEQRLADTAGKTGAFVGDRSGREIVEQEADEVQYRRGFEDHGVAAGLQFDGVLGAGGFFAGGFGESLGIELAMIGGVALGPTGGGTRLHGDREGGVGLAVGGLEASGISEDALALAARENTGGDLPLARGEFTGFFDGAG